ncbi:MAG: RrF2 family transcriptional regulator [Chitinophagaceae bacterium]
MVFSKSFGYSISALLYIALTSKKKEKVQLKEIAAELGIPKPFLGKLMNKIAKEGVLNSIKGPKGGFSINQRTLKTPLIKLVEITGEIESSETCVLRLRKCNSKNPCPLHHQIDTIRKNYNELLSSTTIGDLIHKDQPNFIRSIASI